MNNKNFADVLNDAKDLTLGQIFKLVLKIKYRTALMIVFLFSATVGSAFVAGRYSHQKETAVLLESPFSMRIDVGGKSHDFGKLTLIKDPVTPVADKDMVMLSLREIKGPFDIVQVGKVIARIELDEISGIWRLIVSSISSDVYAKTTSAKFDWRGHHSDYNFKEYFVDKNTIHRVYSDGCILEYKVDSNRRSIPSSFRWIHISH